MTNILIRKIKKVTPHPQADRLNVNYLDVDGVETVCVSNKNENEEQRYHENDLVVFVPEGYILPEKLLKKLEMWNETDNKGVLAGPGGNVVKPVKLRGVLSQGVLFPVDEEMFGEFGLMSDFDEGMDVQEMFNIQTPIVDKNSIETNKAEKGSFEKFDSIENSYNLSVMNMFEQAVGRKPIKWVVMEKIHGANFQVYYDANGIHYGKRTGFLSDDENFYCYQRCIKPEMVVKLKEIYETEKQPIRIFGELFGGKYEADHQYKDQVRILNPKCVQREVQYSPFNEILFYDVKIGDKFLSWKEVEQFIEKYNLNRDCGIQFEKPIKIVEETLANALKENNKFESVISQVDLSYMDLPKLKHNICEGIVIKPYEQEYRNISGQRIIIKSKNEKFAEKRHEKRPMDNAIFGVINDIFEVMKDYVTENRANAVLSKDSWSKKDFGRFMSAFINDIYDSAKKDGVILPTDGKALGMIKQKLSKECLKYKDSFFRVAE